MEIVPQHKVGTPTVVSSINFIIIYLVAMFPYFILFYYNRFDFIQKKFRQEQF